MFVFLENKKAKRRARARAAAGNADNLNDPMDQDTEDEPDLDVAESAKKSDVAAQAQEGAKGMVSDRELSKLSIEDAIALTPDKKIQLKAREELRVATSSATKASSTSLGSTDTKNARTHGFMLTVPQAMKIVKNGRMDKNEYSMPPSS